MYLVFIDKLILEKAASYSFLCQLLLFLKGAIMATEKKEAVGLENLGDFELAEIVRGGLDAHGQLIDVAEIALRELDRRTPKEDS